MFQGFGFLARLGQATLGQATQDKGQQSEVFMLLDIMLYASIGIIVAAGAGIIFLFGWAAREAFDEHQRETERYL